MSSFVEEFKKNQNQERLLTSGIVVLSILAPISLTALLECHVNWIISGATALGCLLGASGLHYLRTQIAEKIVVKYEKLDVGAVLAKKISQRMPQHFVITNRGYSHYYLKCLNTGEQVLVSKDRVREDFDIEN